MGIKIVSRNKKAFHLFAISDRLEAGIALAGSEVKAVRAGGVMMSDCFAEIKNGEAFLRELHIDPYGPANRFNHTPKRTRKLLLHKKEIDRLQAATNEKGFTLIPLSLYFKDHRLKVELGVGKGKNLYDKRASIKEREVKRVIDRAKRTME